MLDIIFDNEYTGPRWTYGLTYRPISIGAIPKGWIIDSQKDHPDFPTFGVVDYPRQLTEKEVCSYELKEIELDELNTKKIFKIAKPGGITGYVFYD